LASPRGLPPKDSRSVAPALGSSGRFSAARAQ